jgi:hypothetical protein
MPAMVARSRLRARKHAGAAPASTHAASAVQRFLAPSSLGEVKELAKMIALAEWAPECYRDIDGNYVVQKLELAIMHGASVGLGPIAAVQSIAIISGKPSIWGDGALSVIEHSGLLEDMEEAYEQDETQGVTAVCRMKRRSRVTPVVNGFRPRWPNKPGSHGSKALGNRIRSACCACALGHGRCEMLLRMYYEASISARRSRILPKEDSSPAGRSWHRARLALMQNGRR